MIMTGALMFDSIIGLACGVTHVGLDFRLSEINRPDVWWWLILTLSNASIGIDNREMKSESGFSFAIASQPFEVKPWHTFPLFLWLLTTLICSHVLPYSPHPPHPVPICQSYKSFSRPNTQRGNWVFHTSTWSVPLYLVLPEIKKFSNNLKS